MHIFFFPYKESFQMNRSSPHSLGNDEDRIWDRIADLGYSSGEELNSPRGPRDPRHGSNSVPNVPLGRGDDIDRSNSSTPRRQSSLRDRGNSSNAVFGGGVDNIDRSNSSKPRRQSSPRDRGNSSNAVFGGGVDDIDRSNSRQFP